MTIVIITSSGAVKRILEGVLRSAALLSLRNTGNVRREESENIARTMGKREEEMRGFDNRLEAAWHTACRAHLPRASLLALVTALSATSAAAQDQASIDGSDIVVTARKRQESILNVPVVETAIPQVQLERLQTQDLKDVATLVPGLTIGDSVLSVGTQVSLRGVGTSAYDPGVDQSVSLNLDGLQLSQGLAYSSGAFDLGQVEVLKGPQALFYGKSSPGGVISLRSADPIDKFEVIARGGYEFEARERRGELIASGPINDQLKARLSGMYSTMDGYFYNAAVPAPGTGAKAPVSSRVSPSEDYIIRGTLLWNPDHSFSARVKANFVHDRVLYAGSEQYTLCPDGISAPSGIPFLGGGEDCKLDRTLRIVDMDPASFRGIPNNGTPYNQNNQRYGTIELNYFPLAGITATSTTGYYDLHSHSLLNAYMSTYAAPPIGVANRFHRHDLTQELRVNSDFETPLNFTAGGYYEDGQFSDLVTLIGNSAIGFPSLLQKGSQTVDIRTYSAFGQARWRIIPKVEITAGARWADEKRSDTAVDFTTGAAVPVAIVVPRIHSDTVSPEFTVTYRPTSDLTFFGALKQGYKSGSFNVATPATPGLDNAYGDEKVTGGELGLKSRLLDRRLAVDLAAYDYRYTGLQVGSVVQGAGVLPVTRTVNAGKATVYGVEFSVAYRPVGLTGLSLHAAGNWNHARFNVLNNVPCYGGQTIAAGCNQILNPATGFYTSQDLSGLPLVRAPLWQVNFGFDYERPLANGLKLAFSNANVYSSRYLADLGFPFYQKGFVKSDLTLALRGPRDRWEIAVIGKNVGGKITYGNCANSNSASTLLRGEITGGTGRGPAGVDEIGCFADRAREVFVRLTLRPFN
jgi:iron complex outermembrane receptor protein